MIYDYSRNEYHCNYYNYYACIHIKLMIICINLIFISILYKIPKYI